MKARGFTLIEMAVVLVIAGIIISIVTTVLPSLLQSARIKKTRAILDKVDNALVGYLLANGRLPYADTNGDGHGDNGSYFGYLPYRDLGLSSGLDSWNNELKYGVYQDLTTTDSTTLCTVLQTAATSGFDQTKLHINQSGTRTNMAYLMVSGGRKDLDNTNGLFDGLNGDNDAEYDDPSRIMDQSYDDLMRATPFNQLIGQLCSGGSGGGGGGGSGVENTDALCSDGIDNDGDGYIDCYDQDCCGPGLTVCPDCPPSDNVQINTTGMPPAVVGNSYSHTFQATGGSGYYYWYLDGISPNIPGLSINLWNGTLSGTIDNCQGNYTVNVRVEDRYDSSKTDSHAFTLTVNNPTLTVTPGPGGGSGPDFTVDDPNWSQLFTVSGGHVGSFQWTINWQGADPGGFGIFPQSETQALMAKTGVSSVGDYAFTLTATDSSCPSNTFTTGTYTMTVTASGAGAPYTAGLVGHWQLDECQWNGSQGEVKDSSTNLYDGTAYGGATTTGSGKICRAASLYTSSDRIKLPREAANGLTDFSLAVWFKTTKTGQQSIISGANSTQDNEWLLYVANSTTIAPYLKGTSRSYIVSNIADGAWHHIVWVRDGTTEYLYLDNTLVGTNTVVGGALQIDPNGLWIGSEQDSLGGGWDPNQEFKGEIDEVMIYARALDEDDVADLYTLTRPSCSGSCYTDPLADYRLDEITSPGQEGQVIDSGRGQSHGFAKGHGSGSPPSSTKGKVCRARRIDRIDGSNGGYLDMGDPEDGDLDPGSRSWTVCCWVMWSGESGENIIYNKEYLYEAAVQGGYVRYAWKPHWSWDGGTSFPITQGQWTHVAVTYDGRRQILYKNGVQVFSRDQTGSIGSNNSRFLIGARGSSNPRNFFDGVIDEFKIYDRALAENEIIEAMNATHPCP